MTLKHCSKHEAYDDACHECYDLQYGGYEIVHEAPSSKDPNVKYKIVRTPNGYLTCECEAFYWRAKCRHINEYRATATGPKEPSTAT